MGWLSCACCTEVFRVMKSWLVVVCPGCGIINRITRDRLMRDYDPVKLYWDGGRRQKVGRDTG